ncbi:MAG: KH domain-containing protein [Clostridia bacterium]|jgi:predicted RNA-binding protein YlqC (UPF0109 family)|nr:KH domain-containing protein [Clostridia bacterium]
MLETIKYIVNRFAEKQDEIEYIVNENGNVVDVTIVLDESDMGKVIGRQGKLAKALRTIVRSLSVKEGKKYNVEIKSKGEI